MNKENLIPILRRIVGPLSVRGLKLWRDYQAGGKHPVSETTRVAREASLHIPSRKDLPTYKGEFKSKFLEEFGFDFPEPQKEIPLEGVKGYISQVQTHEGVCQVQWITGVLPGPYTDTLRSYSQFMQRNRDKLHRPYYPYFSRISEKSFILYAVWPMDDITRYNQTHDSEGGGVIEYQLSIFARLLQNLNLQK